MQKKIGKRPRKRRWNDHNAVSPVVGEVILIGITVVLTGSLVYYLANSHNENPGISISVGATIEKTKDGNWTLTITNGKTNAIDTKLHILDSSTGVAKLSEALTTPNAYFYFNDNNQNGAADAGDVILLNQTVGTIEAGFSVELIKADNIIFGPVKIPS
jgi:flagellin-like protein